MGKLRNWKPKVAADFRARRAELDIVVAVDSVNTFGNSKTPLAGLFKGESGGPGGSQLLFSWSDAQEMLARHGGAEGFMRKVNERLRQEGQPDRAI